MATEKSSIKRATTKPSSSEVDAPKKVASTSEANVRVAPPAKPKTKKSAVSAPAETTAKRTVKKKAEVAEPKEAKTSKARPRPKAATKKPSDATKKELKHLIAAAAYHRAEKRGFAPGYELQDWLDAEAEINEMMGLGG